MRNIEETASVGINILRSPIESLNISYPSDDFDPLSQNLNYYIRLIVGKYGLRNIMNYNEEACLTHAAKVVDRPVKWTADRSEAFLSDAHGRDHLTHVELGLDVQGRFVGMKVHTVANLHISLHCFL